MYFCQKWFENSCLTAGTWWQCYYCGPTSSFGNICWYPLAHSLFSIHTTKKIFLSPKHEGSARIKKCLKTTVFAFEYQANVKLFLSFVSWGNRGPVKLHLTNMWLDIYHQPCQPLEFTTFLLFLLGDRFQGTTKVQRVVFPRHPSWNRPFQFCHTPSLSTELCKAWLIGLYCDINEPPFMFLRSWTSGLCKKSLSMSLTLSMSFCWSIVLRKLCSVQKTLKSKFS